MSGSAIILLCGEGPHDMGSDYTGEEGWLQPVIRKLADEDAHVLFERLPRNRLAPVTGAKRPPLRLDGHARGAYNAMREAKTRGCDILVYMVDNDGRRDRERERWRVICEQIRDGFVAAGNPVCGVGCIPVSASEAWLLADAAAWRQLDLRDASCLPGNRAELIWGKRDESGGNHPHRYFARICRSAGSEDNVAMRRRLGELITLETVARNCPASFAPFARAMRHCLARRHCVAVYDFTRVPADVNWCSPQAEPSVIT